MALPTALLVKGGIGVTAVVAPISAFVIHNEMKKSRLREENKKLNVKITALGITDKSCHFQDTKDKAECELDEAKVKAINFDGKSTESTTFQISGLDTNKKLKLVIEKGYATGDFPEGLRFNLKNTNTGTNEDVTIGNNGNQITLKPGVSYDFKIKEENNTTKLEKAWTITTLGAKVGLTCTNGGSPSTCTIKAEGINVWKNGTDYITGAKGDASKQISVAKDQKDYLEGFKFTVSEDIALTVDGNNGSGINKLIKDNMSYGIDVKNIGGTKTWFLVEKSTASSVPQESQ